MKEILISVMVSLLFINCNSYNQKRTDYIEIKHIGPEQKPERPIFISTCSINIKVRDNYVTINDNKPELYTDSRDLDMLANANYAVLIIDNNTFYKFSAFVKQHSELFTNFKKGNRIHPDYAIIVDSKTYYLNYKQKNAFVYSLIKSLRNDGCNKSSILTLSSYFNDNLA